MARAGSSIGRMLLLAGLCIGLPACGFHPLYATGNGGGSAVEAKLAEIHVALLPERAGQLLREALQARLERGGSGLARRYDLAVSFGITGNPIGIEPDSSISRVRLVGTASWTLTAQDAQRSTLATGVAREVDGYNVFDQQFFAMDLENEAVQRRIADAVAAQMTRQLATYFDRRSAS
jgi:LPS-assembly lipoprotein